MSGAPHRTLQGKNQDGVFWTSMAQSYPPKFCKDLANVLEGSVASLLAEKLSFWSRPMSR